jgi:hypothetical protein
MPFALNNDPSQSEISEAINYLLANFGPNIAADPNTGQITGPSGIVIAYLYRYLAVKFADSFDGSVNFGDSPTNRFYYGVRNTDSDVESTNPADYIWYKVEGGFGTTNFLWYITNGGRQIQFYVGPASPALGYATVGTDSIDLDIITSTTGQISFLAYFQPASLQVVRSGNPLTPSFSGVQPRLYASAGGTLTTYVSASTDSDPAFGNNTWRIGNSSTTGTGDITYNQITIGLPTDGGGFALWPDPTAMSGTPASLLVPVRYKNEVGVVSQANVAQVQFVFIDQGPSGDLIAYPSVYQWAASIPTISGTSTYTWSTGLFTPNPSGWSATPGASTSGFNLYRAQVTLQATAGTTTSTINWTTASIGSIGSAGSAGSSARICFARVPSNPAPVTGTISTSGSSSFPSSSQSLSTWGFSATWGATDPNTSSTDSLYQSDGIYNPASNTTNWSTPYISSLKVGQLSAITVNTGTLTVDTSGYIKGGQTAYNTGTGFFLGYSGGTYKFSIGSSTVNMLWTGSGLQLNGASLTGGTIGIGSGTAFGGYAFYVSSAGVVSVDNIFGGVGRYTNDNYSAVSLQAYTSQAYEALIGTVSATNSSAFAHGVRGINFYNGASGLVGVANGYDFYADGTGTNYGPFTGNHDFLLPLDQTLTQGDLVVDVTCIARNGWSNAIFQVAQSTIPNQAGARGIFIGELRPLSTVQPPVFIDYWQEIDGQSVPVMTAQYEAIKNDYWFGSMSSLGEGQMNVCGEGGNLVIDTLIVSSSTPGVGMAQSDDVIRGKTVAKAREAVTFASPTEIKQVACIYVSG